RSVEPADRRAQVALADRDEFDRCADDLAQVVERLWVDLVPPGRDDEPAVALAEGEYAVVLEVVGREPGIERARLLEERGGVGARRELGERGDRAAPLRGEYRCRAHRPPSSGGGTVSGGTVSGKRGVAGSTESRRSAPRSIPSRRRLASSSFATM